MLFVDDTNKNCQNMHHNSQYLVVVYTHGRGTSIAELKPIFSNKGLRVCLLSHLIPTYGAIVP
jgi:hypothetical protein